MIGMASLRAAVVLGLGFALSGCVANTDGAAEEGVGSTEQALGELGCATKPVDIYVAPQNMLYRSPAVYGNDFTCPNQWVAEVQRKPTNVKHQFQGPFFVNNAELTEGNCPLAKLSVDQYMQRIYTPRDWENRGCVTNPANCPPWTPGAFRKRLKGQWDATTAKCTFVPDVGNVKRPDAVFKSLGTSALGPYRYAMSATINGVPRQVQAGIFIQ